MTELQKVLQRLTDIERRLELLERDSHPPVDLTKPIYLAMAQILQDAAEEASSHAD